MHSPNLRARYTLAVLFAINLLNFYDRNIPGAVVEPVRKAWGLSDLQVGWLATAFTLLYAIVGVPFGRLSDRSSRSRILGIGAAFWSLLTAASGLAWNYGVLFAARLGVGIGEATCAPASNSLIGDIYPSKERSRALSLFMIGLPLGGFLGLYISGRIAATYGWRAPFYVAAIPGLILAFLAFTIPDPPRGAAESSPAAGRIPEGSPYFYVLRIPTMRWIILSGALFNIIMYVVPAFLPAFLSRYHGLHLKEAAADTAVVYSATGILGLLLGGWVADYFGRLSPGGRLLVSAFSTLLQAPLFYFALNRPAGDMTAFNILMGSGCFIGYLYYSGVYATIQDVIPPRLRGTGMAIYFCVMYLIGGSFGPVITGKLSDHYARVAMNAAGASSMAEPFRAAGLHLGLYDLPVCAFCVAVVLFLAARTVAADTLNMNAWMSQPSERAETPTLAPEPAR